MINYIHVYDHLLDFTCFRYHEWMKSEELQQLTASEPLTLAEEYQMQQTWLEDDNSKLTYTSVKKYTSVKGK